MPWIRPGSVEWSKFEFVADVPWEDDSIAPVELTGWEAVVFELADEGEEKPGTGSGSGPGSGRENV